MKNLKTLVRVGIATAVVAAGATFAPQASADDLTIDIPQYLEVGVSSTVTFTGCDAPNTLTVTQNNAAPEVFEAREIPFTPSGSGALEVEASCTEYGSGAVVGSSSASTLIWKAGEILVVDGWETGAPSARFVAGGYDANEPLTLTLTEVATGKVWQTYTGATANADGIADITTNMEDQMPTGSYTIKIVGDNSGVSAEVTDDWAPQDDDDTNETEAAPGGSMTRTAGLPSTGIA